MTEISGIVVRISKATIDDWSAAFQATRAAKSFDATLRTRFAGKLEALRKVRERGFERIAGRRMSLDEWDALHAETEQEKSLNDRIRKAERAFRKAISQKIQYWDGWHLAIAGTRSTEGENWTPFSSQSDSLARLLSLMAMFGDDWVKPSSKRWNLYASEMANILTQILGEKGLKPSLQQIGLHVRLIRRAIMAVYGVPRITDAAIAKYFQRKHANTSPKRRSRHR